MGKTTLYARNIIALIASLALFSFAPQTHADDSSLTFRPRAEFTISYYSLDFGAILQQVGTPPTTIAGTSVEFTTTNMPSIGVGLTTYMNRVYLDLSATRSASASGEGSNTIVGTIPLRGPRSLSSTTKPHYDGETSREEYALSLGYGITDTVSVYAGWKWATNDFHIKASGILDTSFGDPIATIDTEGDFSFNYDGPFIGASLGWPVSSGFLNGTLGANIGIAFLKGNMELISGYFKINGDPIVGVRDFFETSGSATGLTLGLSWVGETAIEDLSYTVNVKGYRYDFSSNETGNPDIKETLIQGSIGIAYLF